MLHVENLSARYGAIQAMSELSFRVDRGDVCLIVGPNGSAKSTALKCICGIVRPSGGRIILNGVDVTAMQPWKHLSGRSTGTKVALVLQGRRLFGALSVADNLRVGGYTLKDARAERRNRDRVLELFSWLKDRMSSPAALLSGGEQQQLALARALMTAPDLLLLDEPTLGLSPSARAEVFEIVRQLHRGGATIIMVEHNAQEAVAMCNRGYEFSVGGGAARPIDVGRPGIDAALRA